MSYAREVRVRCRSLLRGSGRAVRRSSSVRFLGRGWNTYRHVLNQLQTEAHSAQTPSDTPHTTFQEEADVTSRDTTRRARRVHTLRTTQRHLLDGGRSLTQHAASHALAVRVKPTCRRHCKFDRSDQSSMVERSSCGDLHSEFDRYGRVITGFVRCRSLPLPVCLVLFAALSL